MRRLAAALAAALAALALAAPLAHADFGFRPGLEGFDIGFEEEDGSLDAQAGSHPFAFTTELALNSHFSTLAGHTIEVPDGDLRDLVVAQMPGLVADPTAAAPCPLVDFFASGGGAEGCPRNTQLGVSESLVGVNEGAGSELAAPDKVYNLVPPPGVVQEIGFFGAQVAPVIIDLRLSESPPYNGFATLRNIPSLVPLLSSKLTLWGVPADSAHDALRGGSVGGASSAAPWLTVPRSCHGAAATTTTYEADSWQRPGSFLADGEPDLADPAWLTGSLTAHDEAGNPQGLVGCGNLGFKPTIAARPTTRAASSASGLDFSLDTHDEESLANANQGALADSDVEKTVVTLPPGMTVNPSQAEGLVACSEADLARESASSASGEGCPEASRIGTIEVETPLLENTVLHGSLFVATPYANPTGSLIALYVTIKDPGLGISVTQPLAVRPDPRTGQLVTTAEEMPQLPFSHFRLHFREGARAPLISPPGCGSFDAVAKLYPSSGGPPVESTSSFQILTGPGEGPCLSSAPFHPGFEAGTVNNAAGAYSPFDMRLTRSDGEQDMGKFSFVLPPGVVPKLAGIPYCPEAAIALAQSRSGPHGGAEELTHPSCPAASQIGRTEAGAGVGSELTYVPGKLYLAGPYHGDPISAVAITPAVAGPFDAGVVVVREALRLNPVTHVGEVDGAASDPIPHILKGIPLNLRDLRVYADKPEFTLNATSCEPFAAQSTIWGDGTTLEPAGDTPVGLSSRYQAAGCASLGFKPKLGLKLKGGTKRGKFPALHAVYTPRPGDANLSRLALRFPTSEFIEQGHFRTICTRVQFAAGAGDGSACPPASVYGHVRAWSPLLAAPLEGPVYLRSSPHNLPDAVFALHGLVNIDVVVRIDSKGGGLRATVEGAPDAPVSRAIVDMQGGKKGLFVNSTNLCVGKHRAQANATGQNGKVDKTKPLVRAQCKAKRKAHRKRRAG